MRTRPFGKTGMDVSAVGYGAMALSLPGRPPTEQAEQLLGRLLQEGVTLVDTADTYGLGPDDVHHNERLVARVTAALAPPGRMLWIATKGGTRRTVRGWELDGSPEHLYRSICASYQALGREAPIPLWQLHWPDPRYSIAAMLAAVRRALDEKLVRFVGVCNVSREQLQQAQDCLPVVAVQNQFNLWHREAETSGLLEYCEQQDLVFLPWRPLGGLGLSQRLDEIEPLTRLAAERGLSPQRLVIAWHLAKSPCILPIPGSRRLDHILDCLSAVEERLDDAEVRRLDALTPAELPVRERPAAWQERPPLAEANSASI